jgi:serine/threonine-protein kinase
MLVDVGQTLDGRYLLKREIARSARHIVYEAEHQLTRRPVAVKVPIVRGSRTQEDGELLLAEARLLTEARHPCVAAVLDAGKVRGGSLSTQTVPYLVMELLEARSLAGLLTTRGNLSVRDALRIGLPICDALGFIHANGVFHGDLRPSNVFVQLDRLGAYDPPIRIIGFGAAARALLGVVDSRELPATEAGYLAPERRRGGEAVAASDVFSLAAILYECLTGRLPFDGDKKAAPEPPSPRQLRADVPEHVSEAILEALRPDAKERTSDAAAFARALRPSAATASAGERRAVSPAPVAEGVPPPAARDEPPPSARIAPEPGGPIPPPLYTPPPADTRRQFRRASYLAAVRVIRAGDSVFDARCEDISEGGMLLLGPNLVEHGEIIKVRFALPISGEVVTLDAEARWHRGARDGKGAIGVRFIDISSAARALISQYIAFFSRDE